MGRECQNSEKKVKEETDKCLKTVGSLTQNYGAKKNYINFRHCLKLLVEIKKLIIIIL
jgi:hypothetical protein